MLNIALLTLFCAKIALSNRSILSEALLCRIIFCHFSGSGYSTPHPETLYLQTLDFMCLR